MGSHGWRFTAFSKEQLTFSLAFCFFFVCFVLQTSCDIHCWIGKQASSELYKKALYNATAFGEAVRTLQLKVFLFYLLAIVWILESYRLITVGYPRVTFPGTKETCLYLCSFLQARENCIVIKKTFRSFIIFRNFFRRRLYWKWNWKYQIWKCGWCSSCNSAIIIPARQVSLKINKKTLCLTLSLYFMFQWCYSIVD